jgi:N-acetylglutamate synthase-like GNAT family acetyltransferase
MKVRRATTDDAIAIRDLNVYTIQKVNSKDYSLNQIAVWSSFNKIEGWIGAIENQKFWVVIHEGCIVGFGSLAPSGLLDFLYVHHKYQRKGVASRLVLRIEREARLLSIKKVFVSVSITAQPFFLSKGYIIDRMESKEVKGEIFENAQMEKVLK